MSLSSSTNTASTGKSTQTFITALVLNVAIAAVEVGIFMLIRNRFRKIYSPRTYLVPPKKRVNALPHSLVGWIPAILRADAKEIISKNGLDAYMFVRFLYLMMEIFLPFMAVTWVILIPVDIANSGGSNTGIERLTFGNVGLSQQPRYAAHLIVVYILTFYVLYLIKRESAAYVILRQDFLTSVEHSRLAQSKTVLVTGVAKEYLNTESLTKFCSIFKGGVARIWIARTLGDLPESFDRLNVATARLEGATTGILKSASQVIAKNAKAKPKKHNAELNAPTEQDVNQDPALIKKFVDGKDRPHHKLGFLGLFGKKVDSIDWSREQIATSNEELRVGREILAGPEADATYPAESAAFIQFNNQMDAHMFAQCLAHHAPLRMSARYLEVAQEDVIWSNLSISPLQAKGRYAISWAMTIGLIVLWSIPVAFVGLLSNVSALCVSAPWLAWLCKLPTPINGIIQGALPPILLAVLFILLPIILRLFARFQGIPLKTLIELSLMTRFFLFLVIHGFLIITLASGLVNAIPQIANNPSSAVTLLATKLPAASTFFLTYFVTVSLGGAAGALLQIVPLIVYYVKLYILGSTPRSVFGIKYNMGSVAWGTLFPNMTLLTVIGLTYSVIAPLVSGFAFLAFALFWFVYKYLFLYVYDLPPSQETGGLFYPKALGHIFVGLYIEQLCLAGLFFLAQDANKKQSALGEGILMVLLIIITILFQITLGSGYGPLYDYLPLSMSSQIDSIQSGPNTPDLDASTRASNEEKKDRGTFPPPSQRPEDIEALNGHGKDSNSNVDHEEHTDANHLSVHAFDHPATYVTQTTIWVPEDTRGFYKGQVAAIQAEKIKVSTQAAYMNASGKVDVSRSPPDDEWDDSQTL